MGPERIRLLASLLERIVGHDGELADYDRRNDLVLEAVAAARQLGYEAGFRIDPVEPEWPVAYIELPTGQVSWHLPQHVQPWDGHSGPEKVRRIRDYAATGR